MINYVCNYDFLFVCHRRNMQKLTVVMDIWNAYIKWGVFTIEDDTLQLIAKDMVKVKWMRKGKILDAEDFALSINELLTSFSKKLWGDFVEEVFLWLSHPEISISRTHETKRIMNRTVTREDILHLSDVIAESSDKSNFEVIKILPVQWILDDETVCKDPEGMEARRVELIADVFQLPKTFMSSLQDAFQRLDIRIADVVPNILWISEACLDHEMKDLGVLLVDIGANQTSYVVYEEGYPLFYGTFPVWGEHVTKDISIGLQVDIRDAEQIKREQGSVLWQPAVEATDTIDKRFLNDIMTARYEEIFELIQEDLIKHQKDGRLPAWVIITWGWSKVENLLVLAKDVFKLATFTAKEQSQSFGDASTHPQLMSLLGVFLRIQKYYKRAPKRWLKMNFNIFTKIKEFMQQLF